MVSCLLRKVIFLSLSIVLLGTGIAHADRNLSITDTTPQIYADYPFVYPFSGKPFDKANWKMTYASVDTEYADGTNFASLDHAVSGSHHTGEDWLLNGSSYQSQKKAMHAINHGVVVYAGLHTTATRYLVIIRHRAPPTRVFRIPSYDVTIGDYEYKREATTSEFIYSYYLHLDKDLPVKVGDPVYKGQVIGKTYASNDANAAYPPHLHFEIWTRLKMEGESVNDSEGYDPPSVFETRLDKIIEPLAFIDENNCGVDPNNCRPLIEEIKLVKDQWTIKGKGFGSSPSEVWILYKIFGLYPLLLPKIITSGFSSWSDTEIQFTLNSTLSSLPLSYLPYQFFIKRSDNAWSNQKSFPFTDVGITPWFSPYVNELWKIGVVKGVGQWASYAPLHSVQRAELIKMVMVSHLGKDYTFAKPNSEPFSDVDVEDWFAPYIAKAKDLGIVSADPFRPGDPVTRAEAAKIVVATLGKEEQDASCQSSPFPDVADDAWYRPWACMAKELKIFEGDQGNFKPDDELNRAQAAKVVSRAFYSNR